MEQYAAECRATREAGGRGVRAFDVGGHNVTSSNRRTMEEIDDCPVETPPENSQDAALSDSEAGNMSPSKSDDAEHMNTIVDEEEEMDDDDDDDDDDDGDDVDIEMMKITEMNNNISSNNNNNNDNNDNNGKEDEPVASSSEEGSLSASTNSAESR